MTEAVRSINCTNCGAGLPVLGGGRVTTQVCGYCGAALDASDAFRVLEIFDEQKRPASPFRLGMTGKIDGVTFTIIGTLGMEESYRGRAWDWVDHQLFSPTHGYAWLTLEDGHCVLTRKRRDGPMSSFVTTHRVELAEQRPSVRWRSRNFIYYETTNWETTYVEGEFNWCPERGARGTTVSLITNDPEDGMLSFVDPMGGREREIEFSRHWPDAAAAFGIDTDLRPHGTHPLQAIKTTSPWPMVCWFGLMAFAAIALSLVVMSVQPDEAWLHSGPAANLPEALTFTVTDDSRPARVRLYQRLNNDFAGYEVTMTAPDGTVLADTYREISYYSGGSGDESWSEGSRTQTLSFMPPETGDYALAIKRPEATGANADLRVTFQEGRRSPGWLWGAAIAFILLAILVPIIGSSGRMLRWKGSDWSSED